MRPGDRAGSGLAKEVDIGGRLDPIQGVASPKTARASRFTAYESHASHILHGRTHKFHVFQGISCSFLQACVSVRRIAFLTAVV